MKEQFIRTVLDEIRAILSESQYNQLHATLLFGLENIKLEPFNMNDDSQNHIDYLKLYLAAKKIEGCSEKTIRHYESTIKKMLKTIEKEICDVTTDDLRIYLTDYQEENPPTFTSISYFLSNLIPLIAFLYPPG